MIITAVYLYSLGQGAMDPVWWFFLLTFLGDIMIAGAIGR